MKLAGLLLLVSAGLPVVAGADEPVSSQLSTHTKEEIHASVPAFVPPTAYPAEAAAPAAPAAPATVPDSDMLVLPRVTVREKRPSRMEAIDLLPPQERNKKLARDYRNSLTGLDAMLNGFSIPIFSASMAERGRAAYQAQQWEELKRLGQTATQGDPKASAEFRLVMFETERATERQNRPAGGR